MTSALIHQLAWSLPQLEVENARLRKALDAQPLQDHGDRRFVEAYMNPAFGWHASLSMARNQQPCPCICDGDDDVVFRAFLYNCSRSYRDQIITEAIGLTAPLMRQIRATINALLLVNDATIQKVADAINIRPEVIGAYERLFFNVLDRKADEAYLANSIYPNGRLVEMYNSYLDDEPFEDLLKRAAVTSGAWDVLYMAGYGGGLLHAMKGPEIISQFEAAIMLNGLITARNGWLNQQTVSMGLHHARSVLTAAKISGQDTTPKSPMGGLGDTLASEILLAKSKLQHVQIQRRISMAKPADVRELPL